MDMLEFVHYSIIAINRVIMPIRPVNTIISRLRGCSQLGMNSRNSRKVHEEWIYTSTMIDLSSCSLALSLNRLMTNRMKDFDPHSCKPRHKWAPVVKDWLPIISNISLHSKISYSSTLVKSASFKLYNSHFVNRGVVNRHVTPY